ncbi:hypothetical protein ACOME3_002740 [Neoechinorhynchus agilis]
MTSRVSIAIHSLILIGIIATISSFIIIAYRDGNFEPEFIKKLFDPECFARFCIMNGRRVTFVVTMTAGVMCSILCSCCFIIRCRCCKREYSLFISFIMAIIGGCLTFFGLILYLMLHEFRIPAIAIVGVFGGIMTVIGDICVCQNIIVSCVKE